MGSAKYAAAARAASNNIVAVVNLDMLGWDSSGPPTVQAHTHTTSSAAYSNDLALAAVFTNAVRAYGLSTDLAPVIKPSGLTASDHSSFWSQNYAAIVVIEDYGVDFNPYYHTVNDTLARMKLPYFTAATRASLATVAELALPVAPVAADVIEVAAGEWSPSSTNGAGVFIARHLPEATENGADLRDLAWSNAPANPKPCWLKLASAPDGVELQTDSRPGLSESPFQLALKAAAPAGASLTGSNRLRFDFLTPPARDRIYLARIRVDRQFTQQLEDFLCVTNLRPVVETGGHVPLPFLVGVPGDTNFGACDLACRFVDTSAAGCRLAVSSLDDQTVRLTSAAQVGTRIVDAIEVATALDGAWTPVQSFTNSVLPDAASFDAGWKAVALPVERSRLPVAPAHYFRLHRSWDPL